jgi:hypothetical protein
MAGADHAGDPRERGNIDAWIRRQQHEVRRLAGLDAAHYPPRRLMLGEDAYELWDRTIAARSEEFGRRRKRTATAFDDAEMISIPAA